MPVMLEGLPDEPILIATFTGQVTVDTVKEMFAKSAPFINDGNSLIYRIYDTRSVTSSFGETLKIFKQVILAYLTTEIHQRTIGCFVGKHELVKLLVDMLRQEQFGNVQLPIFENLDEALVWIRSEITQNTCNG